MSISPHDDSWLFFGDVGLAGAKHRPGTLCVIGISEAACDKGWVEVEKGCAALFSLHEANNRLCQIHAKMVTMVDQASFEFESIPQGSSPRKLDAEMGDGLLLMDLGLEALEKEKNVVVQNV